MGRNEGIARTQHLALAVEFGLERAGDHKGNLVMHVVGVWRSYGACVKLHQHGHDLRRVTHDLAAQTTTQVGPGNLLVVKEEHADSGGHEGPVNF